MELLSYCLTSIPPPSVLMELLSYCLLLALFLYLFIHNLFQKPDKQKPKLLAPGPWQLPVIGSIHHLLTGSKIPQRKLRDMAKAYGPLMHLKLGQLDAVVISSVEAAEEMLRTRDLQFADKADNGALDIITYGRKDVVMAPHGEYWRQMRKICVQELLSAKRVQSFKSIREEEAANLISFIRSADGAAINLTEILASYTSSVICRAAFGRTRADSDEFVSAFDQVKQLVVGFDFADFFPSWGFMGKVSSARRMAWGLRGRMDQILEKIIQEHRERRRRKSTHEEEEDFVDILLRIEEQGGLEIPLTNDHVKATILDIFVGGGDTTANLMDWTMAELMRNPRVMFKAQDEARKVLGGKQVVTEDHIQKLNYLGLVIKETLRMHPPAPLLSPHKCREAGELHGYHIPKHTTMIINAWALGRDPKYWDEPEAFYPERFESSDSILDYKGSNYKFIPFGAGRRICPGILFSTASAEAILGLLLYFFDWKLPMKMTPSELNMSEAHVSGWNRVEPLFLHAVPYHVK